MTAADTLKTILNAFDFSAETYGEAVKAIIRGVDPLDRYKLDKNTIVLTDDGEEPEFTASESRIISPQFATLEFNEVSITRRDNLYSALKTCFQQSSYSIIYGGIKPVSRLQPFNYIMRVQILL